MERAPRWRVGWVMFGAALVCVYLALAQLPGGFQVRFRRPFTHISAGELRFWVAHTACLLPGVAAICWGLLPVFARLGPLGRRLAEAQSRKVLGATVVFALVGVAIYRLGHLAFLADLPFTDDEWGARFGGQVWASGKLLAELPLGDVVPNVYLFESAGGLFTSMDWPGLLSTWAVAEFTGAGPWVFAFWAAVPLVAVPLAAGRRWGGDAAVVAAIIAFISPMALMLSFTTHVHVVSRGALAIGLCAYVFGRSGERRLPWIIAGFALGFGLITRPFETGSITLPIALWECWQAVRGDRTARRALLWMLPGILVAVGAFLAYNQAVTGSALSPPRLSARGNLEKIALADSGLGLLWYRLGTNVGFNLLLLGVFFLGPLGVAAVALGARDPLSRLLLAGVATSLAVAFAHDNTGVHSVGPIHYADSVVPLTLVAARGAQRAREWLAGWAGAWPAVVTTAVVAAGVFSAHQARSLGAQADVHARIYAPFADPDTPRSVVLAQQYARYWLADPEAKALGTWVFDWRRPDPRGTDRVVIVHDLPGREDEILAAYPDRAAFRLALTDSPPFMQLSRIR